MACWSRLESAVTSGVPLAGLGRSASTTEHTTSAKPPPEGCSVRTYNTPLPKHVFLTGQGPGRRTCCSGK